MTKKARYEIIGEIKRICNLCSTEYSEPKKVYHLKDILTDEYIWACKECILEFPLNLIPKDRGMIK